MKLINTIILLVILFSTHLDAQDAIAYYKQSKEQMLTGKYHDALGSINQALKIDSFKADYFLQKATLHYYLKEYKDALRQCYAANKIEPDKPQIHYIRGLLSLSTENYGGAIFFLSKVINQSAEKVDIYYAYMSRGKAYLKTGKPIDASSDFGAASNLMPDSIEPTVLIAAAYIDAKQHDKAETIVKKIIQTNPEKAFPYKLLGNIYKERKDYTQAESAFNTYCNLVPNDEDAYRNIANLHLENKNYDKARISIEKAINLFPSEPMNFKILAIICIESGQSEEGCNNMFKAFQLGYLERYGYDTLDIYLRKCEGK